MKRDVYKTLCDWKDDTLHKPLLLRGARQVGKTYVVEEFGRTEFESFIHLNFERNPEFKDIFISFDPKEIIERISLFTGQLAKAGKTLLFFDEVQDCPKALMALRYFYEERPQLHVIATGSLLEFALESEEFRMPVGRIQYAYMFPMSFGEFLDGIGQGHLRTYVLNFENLIKIPGGIHDNLNEYIRKYFLIGGMPEVVSEYCLSGDIIKCQGIQQSILDTYMDDFAKYAQKSKHRYLRKIFNAVPTMVGQKFIYAHVDNTIKSRELKEALELLEMAGVVYRVKRTSGAGLPLETSVKESFFKMIFLDIGLLHAVSKVYSDTAMAKDFTAVFKGAVAEQFVGQELMAYHAPYSKPSLYYWAREAKNSNAELDYLIELDAKIIPIEIKAGSIAMMKSMMIFLDNYQIEKGIKISQVKTGIESPIMSLAFYAIEALSDGLPPS
ncbi:MAG: ATP-binding protein [Bacteroidales bacterium]|nr:ATP-binding protein [Bacteroidales bacterium]MCF8456331.1 ATP-binding protein [Bacteroidales bacterium]